MKYPFLALGAMFFGIIAFFLLNLWVGSVSIPFTDMFDILLHRHENVVWSNIVWKSRLPQAVTALVAGTALSVSGLQMQTVFQNPLAGPSVLGISSGAGLGVALVVLASGTFGGVALSSLGIIGEMSVTIAAIIGALLVMGLIIFVSQRVKGNVTLLIVGVMTGYIANSIIGVLKFFSAEEDIHAYVIWGLGSFSRVSGGQVGIFALLIVCVLPFAFLLIKPMNVLLLGEFYAQNLGLNVPRTRLFVIAVSCFLTAIVTAYCGPIIFLGLAVPHLCRGIFRTSDHRVLMPAVLLLGGLLALVCCLIARLPGFEGALPVNSVTALIGAPTVIYVLFHKRNNALS